MGRSGALREENKGKRRRNKLSRFSLPLRMTNTSIRGSTSSRLGARQTQGLMQSCSRQAMARTSCRSFLKTMAFRAFNTVQRTATAAMCWRHQGAWPQGSRTWPRPGDPRTPPSGGKSQRGGLHLQEFQGGRGSPGCQESLGGGGAHWSSCVRAGMS